MKLRSKALVAAAGLFLVGPVAAQLTLFEHDGFRGKHVTTSRSIDNFANSGFNDSASSVEVRGGTWELCTDAYFDGRCVILRPGTYPSLGSIGLNDRISSVRPADQYGRAHERDYGNGRYADRRHGDQDYYGSHNGAQYYDGPRYREYRSQ